MNEGRIKEIEFRIKHLKKTFDRKIERIEKLLEEVKK